MLNGNPCSLYMDEFGTPALDHSKDNVFQFFIVGGLLFETTKTTELEQAIRSIFRAENIQGEAKSKNLSRNLKRHIRLLEALCKLDFHIVGMTIDKASVEKDSGLKWTKSFLKYTSSLLYPLLRRHHDSLDIFLDDYGSDEYKESFRQYHAKKEWRLFSNQPPRFLDSKTSVLIQAADLIAGALGYLYDPERQSEHTKAFWDAIKHKVLFIEEWPVRYTSLFHQGEPLKQFDRPIQIYAERQAAAFISKHDSSKSKDSTVEMQVLTLKYLLYRKKFDREDGYVHADEIVSHLAQSLGRSGMNGQGLRNNVISKLRDAGVVIASCEKGYKIPSAHEDMIAYGEQISGKVIPMLARLDSARNQFFIETGKELDIVDGLDELKELLDSQRAFRSARKTDAKGTQEE